MRIAASFVTAALLTGACGSSRWSHPVTVGAAIDAPIRTVDLLPTALEVWADPRVETDLDQVRLSAEARLVGVATETLYQRGYSVGAVIDWDGNYVGPDGQPHHALAVPQLGLVVNTLANYGTLVGEGRKLPDPMLPVRLGASGADATLYLGGWGFAGKQPDRSNLAGKIVLGVVIVVAVVALVALLAKTKSNSLGNAVAGTARAAGRAAVSVGRTALRAGSAIVDVGRAANLDVLEPVFDPIARVLTMPDFPQHPVWSNDKKLPKKGRPKMYLEMTLVDNRSGRVIWHAHQAYPADPARPREVMKAAKLMLRSLPASM